jgi:hypothetical protein
MGKLLSVTEILDLASGSTLWPLPELARCGIIRKRGGDSFVDFT